MRLRILPAPFSTKKVISIFLNDIFKSILYLIFLCGHFPRETLIELYICFFYFKAEIFNFNFQNAFITDVFAHRMKSMMKFI